MDYQIWIKDEYQELYSKVDCGDLAAVKRELDKAVRAGGEPLLTVEILYELGIKVSEVGEEKKTPQEKYRDGIKDWKKRRDDEATESEAKHDKGAGGEGDGAVRRGDKGATPELDQGSGDPSPGTGAGD